MTSNSMLDPGWESVHRLLDPRSITNVGAVFTAGVRGFLGNQAVADSRIRLAGRTVRQP